MIENINFRLPAANAPKAPAAAPAAKPVYGPTLESDTLKLSRPADDFTRSQREVFAVKEPSKAPGRKFDLGVQLDENTRVSLKPSLKKFKLELKMKF